VGINTRLLARSYPPLRCPVNRRFRVVATTFALLALVVPAAAAQTPLDPAAECSAQLRERFAPIDPDGVDRYLVCRSQRPIEALADPRWTAVEAVVDDAFAGVAPGMRRALALLYRGRRLQVVRGWRTNAAGQIESVTLIAPPPNDSITRLVAGAIIVIGRFDR
jgi:hypothetical protein